ncbi:major facilitator superfamily domain-containing protein [Haematococcus lacustris]
MMLQRGLQLSSAAPTCKRPVVTTTNARGVRQLTAATPSRSSSSKTTRSAKDVLNPSSRTSSPSEVQRGVWAWPDIDASRKLALACSLAFVLSNMDKTNFTIAVIPMGLEMGWSSTTAGLVQSSFFWGFLLMQLPASILSSRFGGSNVLPKGLAVWSGATALIPFVAGSMPGLCLTRALMGAGEAVAPSAIVDMISRTVPPAKRASAVSFAYGGLHAGSLVGLLASPAIIQAVGWPAVFYSFGAVGGLWLLAFAALVRNIQASDPQLAAKLQPLLAPSAASTGSSKARSAASSAHNQQQQEQGAGIPYRALLRHRGVHVLMATHFAHNWHSFTMLAWLPTYFTSALSVDLMHAAQTALLPPLAGLAASTAAGLLGDSLLARGMPTSSVRKLMQTTAFLAPAAFLAYAAQV